MMTAMRVTRPGPARRRLLLGLGAGAVLLLGLAQIGSRAGDAPPHGFDPARLQRIQQAVGRDVSDRIIAGAVTLVARDGVIVEYEAEGFVDAAMTRPMPKDALFRVASMTKPVVSVAAMMLVEQGRLGLDDPVAKYLPELKDLRVAAADGAEPVPARRRMTVLDLLRHTSGFTYSFAGASPAAVKKAYADQDIEQQQTDMPADEMLRRLSTIPLAFQPGTTFEYGVSTDVLGFVIERVTGKRLDAALDEMIFTPLVMKDSSFGVPPDRRDRLAEAVDTDAMKPWTSKWMRVAADRGDAYLSGGGGMVSTAYDYYRFAQMVLNGGELDGVRLLSPATIRFMTSDQLAGLAGSPQDTSGPGYGFGLGFAVRLQDGGGFTAGTRGDITWSGLNGTTFTIDPANRLVGVFMSSGPAQRNHTRFMFKSLIYGALIQ